MILYSAVIVSNSHSRAVLLQMSLMCWYLHLEKEFAPTPSQAHATAWLHALIKFYGFFKATSSWNYQYMLYWIKKITQLVNCHMARITAQRGNIQIYIQANTHSFILEIRPLNVVNSQYTGLYEPCSCISL